MTEKLKGSARIFLSITALLFLLSDTTRTGDLQQDLTFRLGNLERRLDQMQIRVNFVERAVQGQSLNKPNDSTAVILELQRKQLSLSEQVLLLENRLFEMQKAIDLMRAATLEKKETKESGETKETPKSQPKPKPPARNQ
jgi:hypothetical protein